MHDGLKRIINYVATQRYDEPVTVQTDIVMGEWIAWLETIDGRKLWHLRGDDERVLLERVLLYLTSKLIGVEEAAKIIGVNPSRVGHLMAQGRMPLAQKIGENWAFPKAFIEDFAAIGRHAPWKPKQGEDLTLKITKEYAKKTRTQF